MPGAQKFQHYEVQTNADGSLCELGRGAMGITYKAYDTNLRCPVALKVISHSYLTSEVAQQRFFREARAAAALRHPNVASVFHLGQEEGNFFYAMEFVEGETVDALLRREGPIPVVKALQITLQITRALAAADKQNLVHRDLKPANIMIQADSDNDLLVKLIDFGLAKSANKEESGEATITMSGFLGTPHFASPEQLEEKEVDIRSDIYSLGVTLWCMLLGKTPYSGSLAQVMSQHLYKPIPLDQLTGFSPGVVTLLRHMMEKEPGNRPQSPLELRREIEACLETPILQGGGGVVTMENFETLAGDEAIPEISAPPNPPTLPGVSISPVPVPQPPVTEPPPKLAPAPSTKMSVWIAVVAVIVLGGVGAGGFAVYHYGRKFLSPSAARKQTVEAKTEPVINVVVEPTPSPVPTVAPTPDPEAVFQAALAKAEDFNDGTNSAAALDAYVRLLQDYPQRQEIRQRLEGISARLIRDESPLAPGDFEKLHAALESAAKAGIVRAQLLLAQNIRLHEPDRALELFEAVAKTDNVSAMRQGGLLYSNRNHTGDMLRAVALFEQGAALNDAACKFLAGEAYLVGKGVNRDVQKGLTYLREAASLEEPRAWDRLGDYYTREKDYVEALDAFNRARALDYTPSLANLGALYINGQGVKADPQQAVLLFAEGANKGDSRAMVFYAQCLEGGLGVGKNLEDAKKWYRLAAKSGEKRAAEWMQKNGP